MPDPLMTLYISTYDAAYYYRGGEVYAASSHKAWGLSDYVEIHAPFGDIIFYASNPSKGDYFIRRTEVSHDCHDVRSLQFLHRRRLRTARRSPHLR